MLESIQSWAQDYDKENAAWFLSTEFFEFSENLKVFFDKVKAQMSNKSYYDYISRMHPLQSKKFTQYMRRFGQTISKYFQTNPVQRSQNQFDEEVKGEIPEQLSENQKLELAMGFTPTFEFGFSSDEDSGDEEAIIEESQKNLIKNLKSDNFDAMGPPIYNKHNNQVGYLGNQQN